MTKVMDGRKGGVELQYKPSADRKRWLRSMNWNARAKQQVASMKAKLEEMQNPMEIQMMQGSMKKKRRKKRKKKRKKKKRKKKKKKKKRRRKKKKRRKKKEEKKEEKNREIVEESRAKKGEIGIRVRPGIEPFDSRDSSEEVDWLPDE